MLNVGVLTQIAGVILVFGRGSIGTAAIPLGVALLIRGGIIYRRELKSDTQSLAVHGRLPKRTLTTPSAPLLPAGCRLERARL
jgi:hypothetical protein